MVPKQEAAETMISPFQFNADPTQSEYLDSPWKYFWDENGSLMEIVKISSASIFFR